jgi:hypothetical protein
MSQHRERTQRQIDGVFVNDVIGFCACGERCCRANHVKLFAICSAAAGVARSAASAMRATALTQLSPVERRHI